MGVGGILAVDLLEYGVIGDGDGVLRVKEEREYFFRFWWYCDNGMEWALLPRNVGLFA